MIEGLKVTIDGNELRELCAKRANHHRDRAEVYARQIQSMEESKIEGMQYTSSDPQKALNDKKAQHEFEAEELTFIADHLSITEQYLLDREALYKLGIANRGW